MADRRVTQSGKDNQGDITKLCNLGQLWSPRYKADAIRDIDANLHQYYTQDSAGNRATVRTVQGPNGKFLRTDADKSSANNLDNLPDC